ncbi:MAG TPA: hypothetical protein VM755_09700 [Stellaceae bacterium]|nr:hypothetical protein [Stellaceae bacterium]
MRLAVVVMLGLGLAACAAPSPPPQAAPPGPAAGPGPMGERLGPARVEQTALGPVLTDGRGLTLYTFDNDRPGVSNCSLKCAQAWPPFMAGPGARPQGAWTLVGRRAGEQWAYKGQPLYTFFKDYKPGQTAGDGLRGVWHIARP